MRTIKYTVSYEKLISRIPAMFAFVRINEQGTPSIVKATDGEQGNYGGVSCMPDVVNNNMYIV